MISSHSDVIAAFGGLRLTAEAIGVDPKLATHWLQRGIPAKYWPLVEGAARERDIAITARALLDLMKQRA